MGLCRVCAGNDVPMRSCRAYAGNDVQMILCRVCAGNHVQMRLCRVCAGNDVPGQLGAHRTAGGRERRHMEGRPDPHLRHGLMRVPSPGPLSPTAATALAITPRTLPHDPPEYQVCQLSICSSSVGVCGVRCGYICAW